MAHDSLRHGLSAPRIERRGYALLGVAALVVIAVSLTIASIYGRSSALSLVIDQARSDGNLKVALLRAVLERPRSLPLLLAEDQQVLDGLQDRSVAAIGRLNDKLERLVAGTSASVLYVIDRDGRAIASSNWREPASFVGSDYSFREYFRTSMQEGTAEHFALGSVSKRPGLYISRRVGTATAPSGVVVVKAEFDQLETDWREATRSAFVTDANGIVLISSIESWRFMTLTPLPPKALEQIRVSLQYGDAGLRPLPFRNVESVLPGVRLVEAVFPGSTPEDYLHLDFAVPSTGWKLNYLVPVEPTLTAGVREARLLTLAILLPLLVVAALLIWRREASLRRLERARQDRLELERRVDARTLDLSRARDRLEAEIAGHKATEARLQGVQQDLVQANRLAILGQVAAGVAHEINQPVATIRAYAENAGVFLERSQMEPVRANLSAIGALTERIGMITEELKAFSRKGRSAPEPVLLGEAIEGALMLLKSRFAGRLDRLVVEPTPPDLKVKGNRVRLEQVLINLFQNALEALDGRDAGRVDVDTRAEAAQVFVHVRDNGPGIPDHILPALFTPFTTSKEKGLGLGLVIARDILGDYGGSLHVDSGESGTCFTITLERAEP